MSSSTYDFWCFRTDISLNIGLQVTDWYLLQLRVASNLTILVIIFSKTNDLTAYTSFKAYKLHSCASRSNHFLYYRVANMQIIFLIKEKTIVEVPIVYCYENVSNGVPKAVEAVLIETLKSLGTINLS